MSDVIPSLDKTKSGLLILGVALAGVAAWWLYKRGEKLVTEDLNPASEKNVANTAVNSVVSAVAGKEETLGGAVADWYFWLKNGGRNVEQVQQAQTADALAARASTNANGVNSFSSFLDRLKQSVM